MNALYDLSQDNSMDPDDPFPNDSDDPGNSLTDGIANFLGALIGAAGRVYFY